jgi:hypothetical protein
MGETAERGLGRYGAFSRNVRSVAQSFQAKPNCRQAMKHPARSDFHTVVTEAGVSITFKPTNSTYRFYRVADNYPVSCAGVQHGGHDTEDYPSDEVQDMAQQIASEHARSIWPGIRSETELAPVV